MIGHRIILDTTPESLSLTIFSQSETQLSSFENAATRIYVSYALVQRRGSNSCWNIVVLMPEQYPCIAVIRSCISKHKSISMSFCRTAAAFASANVLSTRIWGGGVSGALRRYRCSPCRRTLVVSSRKDESVHDSENQIEPVLSRTGGHVISRSPADKINQFQIVRENVLFRRYQVMHARNVDVLSSLQSRDTTEVIASL